MNMEYLEIEETSVLEDRDKEKTGNSGGRERRKSRRRNMKIKR